MKKVLLFILTFIVIYSNLVAQRTYINTEFSYSIDIPKGWEKIPDIEVNQLASMSPNAKYDAGFYPVGNNEGNWGYPYILLSFFPVDISGISFEKAAKQLAVSLTSSPMLENIQNPDVEKLFLQSKSGDTFYDRIGQKLYININSYIHGQGQIKGVSIMHFSRRGILTINCYEKEGQGFASLFDLIIKSSSIF